MTDKLDLDALKKLEQATTPDALARAITTLKFLANVDHHHAANAYLDAARLALPALIEECKLSRDTIDGSYSDGELVKKLATAEDRVRELEGAHENAVLVLANLVDALTERGADDEPHYRQWIAQAQRLIAALSGREGAEDGDDAQS